MSRFIRDYRKAANIVLLLLGLASASGWYRQHRRDERQQQIAVEQMPARIVTAVEALRQPNWGRVEYAHGNAIAALYYRSQPAANEPERDASNIASAIASVLDAHRIPLGMDQVRGIVDAQEIRVTVLYANLRDATERPVPREYGFAEYDWTTERVFYHSISPLESDAVFKSAEPDSPSEAERVHNDVVAAVKPLRQPDWDRVEYSDNSRVATLYYRTEPTDDQAAQDAWKLVLAMVAVLKADYGIWVNHEGPWGQEIKVTAVCANLRDKAGRPLVRNYGFAEYSWSNDAAVFHVNQAR